MIRDPYDYQQAGVDAPDDDWDGWCPLCACNYCGHTPSTRGPEPDYDSDRNIDMEES